MPIYNNSITNYPPVVSLHVYSVWDILVFVSVVKNGRIQTSGFTPPVFRKYILYIYIYIFREKE